MPVTELSSLRGLSTYVARESIKTLYKDLPVSITENSSLAFGEHPSFETLVMAGRIAIEASRANSLVLNFIMGDVWNAAGREDMSYGYRAKVILEIAGGNRDLAKKMNTRFRQAGWVAGKWPYFQRHMDKSWNYHKVGNPNEMNEDLTLYTKMPDVELWATNLDNPNVPVPVIVGAKQIELQVTGIHGDVNRVVYKPKDVNSVHYKIKNIVDTTFDYINGVNDRCIPQ